MNTGVLNTYGLLSVTEGVGDRVTSNTWDGRVGVLDDLAVLDVDTVDLGEVTVGGTVIGDDCMKSLSMIYPERRSGQMCIHWVTTVIFWVVSMVKPGPRKDSSPIRKLVDAGSLETRGSQRMVEEPRRTS